MENDQHAKVKEWLEQASSRFRNTHLHMFKVPKRHERSHVSQTMNKEMKNWYPCAMDDSQCDEAVQHALVLHGASSVAF